MQSRTEVVRRLYENRIMPGLFLLQSPQIPHKTHSASMQVHKEAARIWCGDFARAIRSLYDFFLHEWTFKILRFLQDQRPASTDARTMLAGHFLQFVVSPN